MVKNDHHLVNSVAPVRAQQGSRAAVQQAEHGGLYAEPMPCDHQQRTECGWHQGYPFVSDCYALVCVGREVNPLGVHTHGQRHNPRAYQRQRHKPRTCQSGRAAAEGFSPTPPRAHWIGPEFHCHFEGSALVKCTPPYALPCSYFDGTPPFTF